MSFGVSARTTKPATRNPYFKIHINYQQMKKATILSLLLFLSFSVFGQNVSDSISVKSLFGGCKIYQYGQQITVSNVGTIVKPNELAYSQFQKAQSTNVISMIIGGVGGALIGYPLGGALAGKQMDWKMFGIGAALAVISIPISNKCVKQLQTSVDTYNDGLKAKPQPTIELNVKLTGSGLSIAMIF